MKAATPQHYALVTEAEVPARHKDPTWQGFVEPASYGAIHTELPAYLLHLFAPLKKARRIQESWLCQSRGLDRRA